MFAAVLFNQFLLFQFPETVGIESFLGRIFQRARLIDQVAAFQTQI